jgi:hypothetical protein
MDGLGYKFKGRLIIVYNFGIVKPAFAGANARISSMLFIGLGEIRLTHALGITFDLTETVTKYSTLIQCTTIVYAATDSNQFRCALPNYKH